VKRHLARVTGVQAPWPEHRITGRHRGERLTVPTSARIVVESARLEDVDLSGQRLDNYLARGSSFDRCDFTATVWGGGVLGDVPQVEYRDCDFSRADLKQTGPRFARFVGCRFAGADLDGWNAMCAEFVDCTFTGRLTGVRFSGVPWGIARDKALKLRKRNEFTGNDFTVAELVDCMVAGGIDLDANRWPADHLVVRDAQRRIEKARSALPADERTLSPGGMSPEAALLATYSIGAFALQRDLLLHPTAVGADLARLPEP
jgi:hypothetical protein